MPSLRRWCHLRCRHWGWRHNTRGRQAVIDGCSTAGQAKGSGPKWGAHPLETPAPAPLCAWCVCAGADVVCSRLCPLFGCGCVRGRGRARVPVCNGRWVVSGGWLVDWTPAPLSAPSCDHFPPNFAWSRVCAALADGRRRNRTRLASPAFACVGLRSLAAGVPLSVPTRVLCCARAAQSARPAQPTGRVSVALVPARDA